MSDFGPADHWLALGSMALLVVVCFGMLGIAKARDYWRNRRKNSAGTPAD